MFSNEMRFQVYPRLALVSLALTIGFAHGQALLSAGFENDFDLAEAGAPSPIGLPPGLNAINLVAMGVGPDDTGYFWWSDGTVSLGSAVSTSAYQAPRTFSPATGKRATDIAGIAVDYTGDVYCYYLDGTASIGTPYDLDALNSNVIYTLPQGYTPRDIVGAATLDDDIMLYMRDGTFHIADIDEYNSFVPTARSYAWDRYTVPAGMTTANILGMDFGDSDGRLYTIYAANQSGFGVVQTNNATRRRILQRTDARPRRRARVQTQSQPQQPVQPQDGVSVGPDGITLRKDGFSFTLPSRREN